MKLELQYSSVIQGEFNPSRVNIMLVMQVNCPGCLLYAIPGLVQLHEEFKNAASFFILSTAFEDFELNTEANTRRLIKHGEMVGETKRTFDEHYNLKQYHQEIPFTVMFDKIVNKEQLISEEMFVEITKNQRQVYGIPQDKQKDFSNVLFNHFQAFPKVGYTFAVNILAGTPTFLVFDENLQILHSWFGHKNLNEVIKVLKPLCSLPNDILS